MYQFSRAIYRELTPHIDAPKHGANSSANHEQVLHACEAAVERLATDRHYFAHPARTLFCDIRTYFPMRTQKRVYQVVSLYLGLAQRFLTENPLAGYAAISGKPLQCRATTRKGEACQRNPLPHNGYCPSHQHLADTEDHERQLAA
ncbi:MAG: hypothetical protein ACRDK2_16470 [Solirubrobacteraceae bacterium]